LHLSRDPLHVGREVGQQLIYVDESVSVLDTRHMPVMPLRRMVVAEHRRLFLSMWHEREPVPHAAWAAWRDRHSPYHQLQDVAPFVDDLLSSN